MVVVVLMITFGCDVNALNFVQNDLSFIYITVILRYLRFDFALKSKYKSKSLLLF